MRRRSLLRSRMCTGTLLKACRNSPDRQAFRGERICPMKKTSITITVRSQNILKISSERNFRSTGLKEKIFRGCGTALVTPFKDGAVDFGALGGILELQKAAGIHFLVPLGTTAETPCLTATEKVDILVFTKERCPGIPIIAGEEGIMAGCGVATLSISYYNLGEATAVMAYDILVNGADITTMDIQFDPNPVKEYNEEICNELGIAIPAGYIKIGA